LFFYRNFVAGMKCVEKWSTTCLSLRGQMELESSIAGALHTYSSLCTDFNFQSKLVKNANCYRRVSSYWDDCTSKFINFLKKIDYSKNGLALCWYVYNMNLFISLKTRENFRFKADILPFVLTAFACGTFNVWQMQESLFAHRLLRAFCKTWPNHWCKRRYLPTTRPSAKMWITETALGLVPLS